MKRNPFLFLLVLVALVYLPSCKKEDAMVIVPTEFYPLETDTMASFVACKMKSGYFVSYDSSSHDRTNNFQVGFLKNGNKIDTVFMLFGISSKDTYYENVGIKVSNIADTGKYIVAQPDAVHSNMMFYHINYYNSSLFMYETSNKYQGELHIKKWDKKKKWIAGTFYASLRFGNIGDSSIKVTEGLFNIHYY